MEGMKTYPEQWNGADFHMSQDSINVELINDNLDADDIWVTSGEVRDYSDCCILHLSVNFEGGPNLFKEITFWSLGIKEKRLKRKE